MEKISGTPAQLAARRLWIDALRSGKYEQTQGVLNRVEARDDFPAGMCCLGVACDVSGIGAWKIARQCPDTMLYRTPAEVSHNMLPRAVEAWLGLGSLGGVPPVGAESGRSLWQLNDYDGFSFSQIADVIEANWEVAPAN